MWTNLVRNDALEPIAFYPYTSVVLDRFFEIAYGGNDDTAREFELFREELISVFRASNIKAFIDNKTVFQVMDKTTRRSIFYGFYDWKFSIGFSVKSETTPYEKGTFE